MSDFEHLVHIGDALPEHAEFIFEYRQSEEDGKKLYADLRSHGTSLPFSVKFDHSPQYSSTSLSITSLKEKIVSWHHASTEYEVEDDQVKCTFEQPSGTTPLHWHIPRRAGHTLAPDDRIPTDTYEYQRPATPRTVIALARLAAYYARKNQIAFDQATE